MGFDLGMHLVNHIQMGIIYSLLGSIVRYYQQDTIEDHLDQLLDNHRLGDYVLEDFQSNWLDN